MHFDDAEKPGRKAALKNLMSMIGGETSKKLAGLKKPALAIEVDGPEEEGHEGLGEEPAADDDDDLKAKLADLEAQIAELKSKMG